MVSFQMRNYQHFKTGKEMTTYYVHIHYLLIFVLTSNSFITPILYIKNVMQTHYEVVIARTGDIRYGSRLNTLYLMHYIS